jgi:hypothetical protein
MQIIASSPESTPATHIRGTMLASSLATARSRGMEQAYFAALPAALHADVREVVPQAWAPIDLAVAHYLAMEAAFPDTFEQVANGRLASERTQSGYVATIIRALKATGNLDMSDVLKRVPAALARLVLGGSCVVYKCATKDARIELSGFPFLAAKYTHNAWQGMFEGSFALLSRRIFFKQDLAYARTHRMALHVSWV